jgi:hypothetical protein
MSVKTGMGAGNRLLIFGINSTYTFKSTLLMVYNKIKKTDIKNHPKVKAVVISPDELQNNSDLTTHLAAYLSNRPPVSVEETYEDGTIESFMGGDTTKQFGFIWYGTLVGTKRETLYGIGMYSGDTGSKATEPNKPVGTKIEITSIQASTAYTVPTGCLLLATGLNSEALDGGALLASTGLTAGTISSGTYGTYRWSTAG